MCFYDIILYMKNILLLLSIFISTTSFGEPQLRDGCTENGKYASKYTIDKRCYLTDEQKQQSPYNSVVVILNDKLHVHCTGTIVKKDEQLYIYTARHCVDTNNDNKPDLSFYAAHEDAYVVQPTELVGVGNHKLKNTQSKVDLGDWAIYKIKETDVPFVELTDKHNGIIGKLEAIKEQSFVDLVRYGANFDARIVGYGSLAIMSDNDIAIFKQKYIDALAKNNLQDNHFNLTQRINMGNQQVVDVVYHMLTKREWLNIFDNQDLKVSYCHFTTDGTMIGCQGWNKNSGSPVFDNQNRLMGIATTGRDVISSQTQNHAVITDGVSLFK